MKNPGETCGRWPGVWCAMETTVGRLSDGEKRRDHGYFYIILYFHRGPVPRTPVPVDLVRALGDTRLISYNLRAPLDCSRSSIALFSLPTPQPAPSIQPTSNIRKLSLLQLILPENRRRIPEPMLDPPILFDMIQVDEPSGIGIPVRGGEDTAAAELEGFVFGEVVAVFGVEDAVGEGLAGADTEEVAREAGAVVVDVVEGGAFLGGDAGAHGTLERGD